MKLKQDINLETLMSYGFFELFKEENLPSKITEWRNDFTDEEIDEFSNLYLKDEEYRQKYFVISDSHTLYYYENVLVYNIGHSRRGQFYYLILDKTSLQLSILASKADGEGSSISLPDVILKLYKNGLIDESNIS